MEQKFKRVLKQERKDVKENEHVFKIHRKRLIPIILRVIVCWQL